MSFKFRFLVLVLWALLLVPGFAQAQIDHLNTSGRCGFQRDCEIGDSNTNDLRLITDVEQLDIGDTTAATLTLTVGTTATAVFQGADAAGAANTLLDTTGAGTVNLGSVDVTSITAITDGASLELDTTVNTLILKASSTNSATFMGEDAAGNANTIFDTTGAGNVQVGSADVTSVTVVSDGGTVTIDGSVAGKTPVVSLASGALTINTVHLATATGADYDIPATDCNDAADLGKWVTVIVEDASSTISITSDNASDQIIVPLLSLGTDDELDSVADANGEGTHITLVCMVTNGWYATSMSYLGVASMALAWADGGPSD